MVSLMGAKMRGTLDRPMHRLTPAEHAAMGWAHGQYKDGICTTLMCEQNAEGVAEFIAEAAERGAVWEEAAQLVEGMGRTVTWNDEDLGPGSGKNLVKPLKVAAALRARKDKP
jgi:hypothetical protein